MLTEGLSQTLADKYERLRRLLAMQPGLVAFSGGVDSSLLLLVADQVRPAETVALFADSLLQAEVDRDNVRRVAGQIGASLRVVPFDPLSWPDFTANTPERCYYCKRMVFRQFRKMLPADLVLMDGTHREDSPDNRPGHRALKEVGVISPLRQIGLAKEEIRTLARYLGLSNWDRPSSSCLATRIPVGKPITVESLGFVEECERLIHPLGLGHVRVRPDPDRPGWLQVELAREQLAAPAFNLVKDQIRSELHGVGALRVEFVGRDGVYFCKIK